MATSKNKPSFEFCAKECGVLKFCPLGCICELSSLYGSLVFFACVVCLGWLFEAW